MTGKGGHAASPHHALDPIPIAAEIVVATQVAITRQISVFDPAVVTFAAINAGTTNNIIPQDAHLQGTIRTFAAETRDRVRALVASVAEGVAAAHGATVSVAISPGYPVTVNDPGFVSWLDEVTAELVGREAVGEMDAPIMGVEDFSYVLQQVPGAMTQLGACPPEWDPATAPHNHSNLVRFDEGVMADGMALYAAVALEHTNRTG